MTNTYTVYTYPVQNILSLQIHSPPSHLPYDLSRAGGTPLYTLFSGLPGLLPGALFGRWEATCNGRRQKVRSQGAHSLSTHMLRVVCILLPQTTAPVKWLFPLTALAWCLNHCFSSPLETTCVSGSRVVGSPKTLHRLLVVPLNPSHTSGDSPY